MTSEQILAAYVETSHEAYLEELIRRHHGRLLGMLCRFTADPHISAEALQTAWIAVWRRGGSFRGTSCFDTWLYGVARNAALSLLRQQTSRRNQIGVLPSEQLIVFRESVNEPSDNTAVRRELADYLKLLGKPQRRTIILKELRGLSGPQTARRQGIPPGTVKSRLNKGLAVMRKGRRKSGGG